MLELNDNTEKESRNCTNYEYNLLHQYEIKIMVMQFAIKKYGLQVFLGHEEPATEYK